MSDHNFDNKAEWFQRRIYGGMKGTLRLNALWGDMQEYIPGLAGGSPLSVWDAGGGLGQMSIKLGTLGHRVVLNDISAEMLALAREAIADAGLETISIEQSSIQQHAAGGAAYQLIVCHAVLEWLSEPELALQALLACLKPGGYLSLAVYNVNATILMNVLKGNFNKALSGEHAGQAGSLTPPAPQDPFEVLACLEEAGLDVICRSGVRVAFDYLPRDLRAQRSDEDLQAVENYMRGQEAFWALGRYVHFIVRRPD